VHGREQQFGHSENRSVHDTAAARVLRTLRWRRLRRGAASPPEGWSAHWGAAPGIVVAAEAHGLLREGRGGVAAVVVLGAWAAAATAPAVPGRP
jgi:hypothetical protein